MDPVLELLQRPLPETLGGVPRTLDGCRPAASQRRQSYEALEVAAAALECEDPMGSLGALTSALLGGRQAKDRPRVVSAAALIVKSLPAGSYPVPDLLDEAASRLSAAESAVLLTDHPCLAVLTPLGRVWFCETHPATHLGGTEDDWMSRRLAAHRVLGKHLPGYAGVAVFTPRAQHISVHTGTEEDSHLLGACHTCLEVTR